MFVRHKPIAAWCCLLAAAGIVSAQPPGDANRRPTGQPALASRPAASQTGEWAAVLAAAREFQPGLRIDWQRQQVLVAGRVVLRRGPLEYFACRPGKEHESIVLIEPAATHVCMALGLVGLVPGRPPRWDEARQRWIAPTGDQVDVLVLYEQLGRWRCVDAWEWMLAGEPPRTPLSQPWVFSGSLTQPDGQLLADRDGDFLAVVDKPAALLCLADAHTDANDQLWCVANPERIPPTGTRVWLVLRAARPREWQITLAADGKLTLDGRPISAKRLATLLQRRWRLTERRPAVIQTPRGLHQAGRELGRRLIELGAPPASFRVRLMPSPTTRPTEH